MHYSVYFGAVSNAEPYFEKYDFSITALYGDKFKVDPEEQFTITLEWADSNKFGDNFIFYDFTSFVSESGEDGLIYGEITPRFSSQKIFKLKKRDGFYQDTLLAFTHESGKGEVESYLYGVGFDFKVPGFTYFQANFYYRDPDNNESEGWQFTPVFRVDIPVGKSVIVIDGYMDWVFKSENIEYEENLNFNPQIKYDLGLITGMKKNKLMVGVEWDYWENKYGIKSSSEFNTDQNVVSALVKYHF